MTTHFSRRAGNWPARARICERPFIGLVSGAIILTADGQIPVEFLTPGDRIVSRAHGLVPLLDITARMSRPHLVRFDRGVMGDSQEHSALLSAGQPVLLRGAVAQQFCGAAQGVVPCGVLADGLQVHDLGEREARLFHLGFAGPEIVYSDGIEVVVQPSALPSKDAA